MRIVIRHGLFSCVYKVSADTADVAAIARPIFRIRALGESSGAYPEDLGPDRPQTKINYTNWTV